MNAAISLAQRVVVCTREQVRVLVVLADELASGGLPIGGGVALDHQAQGLCGNEIELTRSHKWKNDYTLTKADLADDRKPSSPHAVVWKG